MKRENLVRLKGWFTDYCRSFKMPNDEDQRNIFLKEEHTYEVCVNILHLAEDLGLDENSAWLAEAVALFHDVGRFPQYHRYRTFKDSASVNHAALGVQVLKEMKVLENLPEEDRITIIRSVGLHNVFTIPKNLDEKTSLFVRLIRDADKLDIWRVFIEYYRMPKEERASEVGLGLPDIPEYSPDILECLQRGEMVNVAKLRTLNDFRLLQLSWVYDLNFTKSFAIVEERGYINRIVETLPKSEEIARTLDIIREFVGHKIR